MQNKHTKNHVLQSQIYYKALFKYVLRNTLTSL